MFTILGADGKEYGPVTADKVHEWIKAGRANAHTRIKRAGETEWATVGTLVEFAPAPNIPPPLAALPPEVPPAPVAAAVPVGSTLAQPAALAPASRWLRLGGAIIDGIIASFLMTPGLMLMFTAGFFSKPANPNTPLLLAGCGLLGLGFLVLLAVQIYLLTTRGQTIGKKLVGLRIVSFEDGTNPGFVKAFLLRSFVNGLIGAVPALGGIYSLVDICFIFRDDRRCIHDLIAGTVVIKA